MGYDRLRTRLNNGVDCRDLVTFPDGSIDHYYTVVGAKGDRISTRAAFIDRLNGGNARSLQLVPKETRVGGQAVNTAEQVKTLGQSVRLYGHLDDPRFDSSPFETISMGTPATVHVLSFEREDLMLSVESSDIGDWTIQTVFETLAVDPDEWIDDEVVVIQNWVGFPEMTDALMELAEVDLGCGTIVFDPGDVSQAPAAAVRSVSDALSTLADHTTVVLTANDAEIARIADVLGIEAEGTCRESRLRTALGASAVILHDRARAVAATGTVTTVENHDTKDVVRRTGAGDRFDGGLAVGLAAGMPWEDALALGNTCASFFVQTGTTGTLADLVEFLED